jgi:diguanylate cyclase (GGDEF)-like protein
MSFTRLQKIGLMFLLAFGLRAGAQTVPGFTENPRLGRTAFRSYGPDEGLSSLGINHLAQDQDGYLWLGTDLGLFRYDGHRFLHLSRKEGLPADTVSYLWADPQGGLWASSGTGLAQVLGTKVRRVDGQGGLPESAVLSMARDASHRLWIAMGRKGLYREDRPGQFVQVPEAARPWVLVQAPRHEGMFVFGPQDQLRLFKNETVTQSWTRKEGLGLDPSAALEDGEGRLWVLDRAGLFFKSLSDTRFRPFPHPVVAPGGQTRNLVPDGQGGLWAATVFGLLHIRGTTYQALGAANGLPTKYAAAALVDREGSFWYAAGGLYRELGLGAWANLTTEDGLPNDLVWNILRDAKGRLWAGTERGLAVLEGTRWRGLPATESMTAFSLIPEADGSLLASGTGLDIIQVDPSARGVRVHRLPGLDPLKVGGLRMLRTRSGLLWVAAGNELLGVSSKGGRLQVDQRIAPPAGTQMSADVMLEDREGRIWIAGSSGLFEFHQGRWTRFGKQDGLLDDSLGGMVEAPDGSLLVCYRDSLGVTCLRRETQGIKVQRHYREAAGDLPTDAVFSIHVEPSGHFWLNTNLGAVQFQTGSYRTFGRASGLLNQDMVQGAFFADPQEGLWFGSSGGLVRFDHLRFPWKLPLPQPTLSTVRFGARELGVGDRMGLRIQPRDNTFETQLGCLSFSREKAYKYQSRLEGLEQDWRVESIPQARFAALPPGRYQYQVRTLFDGQAGPVATLGFEVLPRWYQSWLFRSLLALSLIPLIGGISAWRNRRLRAQNEQLEAVVSARTLQLEEANRMLEDQMLHDPLTGLYNRRFLALTMPEQMARITRDLEGSKGQPFLGGHPMAFFLLDVDHFKRVNDEHGHGAGDQVLVELAHRFREATRDSDTVIRWGGEEFLVVARQLGTSDPPTLAERLRRAVEAKPFLIDSGVQLSLTLSVGFCPFPMSNRLPTMPWDKGVMLADRALYAAKRTGRNRWVGLDEGPAFDAEELAAFAGHPDIPSLLHRKLLHGLTQTDEVPDSAWV